MKIGFNCGSWANGPFDQYDCKCLGIKHGDCPRGYVCEGETITCLGFVTECYKINFNPESQTREKEIISC